MNRIALIPFLIMLVAHGMLTLPTLGQNAIDFDEITEKIKSAQKVEELYPIKYNLDKYTTRTDLSLEEQRKLKRTFVMLSASFKSRSHYKNAADVYLDYLKLNENYLNNYNTYIKDSLLNSNQQIKNTEINRIAELDKEIDQLNKTRKAVAGLKSRYYSLGSMATIGIIVLFLVIFITRNRSIRLTQNKLISIREKLLTIYRDVLNTRIQKGSIAFGKFTMVNNVEIIDSLLSNVGENDDQKSFSKAQQSLVKAKDLFSKLSS